MLGLVLEGDGARGAYHIVAYKALLEEGFTFGGVCQQLRTDTLF